jgi:hypothetical protein
MASPVQAVRTWSAGIWGTPDTSVFLATLFSIGLIVEPVVLLLGAAWLTGRGPRPRQPVMHVVGRYAFSLVPVGVGIWTAHYGFHLLAGFWTAVPVLQESMRAFGAPPPAEALWHVQSLAPAAILPIQTGAILLGTLGSLIVAYKIAEREHPSRALAACAPWAALSLLLGSGGLWVMAQPMEMRGLMIM